MFGTLIKQKRKDMGYTQQQIADIFKIKQNTWSEYENNKYYPPFDEAIKIANFLNIDLYDIKI